MKIPCNDDQSFSCYRSGSPLDDRGWLIAGGLPSVFVGFLAIGSPLFFSIVVAQFLGAFALVSGVIALFVALFGKEVTHRALEALFALIRVAAALERADGFLRQWPAASLSLLLVAILLAVAMLKDS